MEIRYIYPFAAIVGQEKMKLGLSLNIIKPVLSGVLIRGKKGTAKSTAVRALADILPMLEVVERCPFQLWSWQKSGVCTNCTMVKCKRHMLNGKPVKSVKRKMRVVQLPVGATEDRISFPLEKGKMLGLVGESGAGKSMIGLSLLRLISKPGKIVGGKAYLDGIDLFSHVLQELPK